MNNLDRLFDKARQSLQEDMPVEDVQRLIHGQQPTNSWWGNQKYWIMTSSMISIITIAALFFWNTQTKPQSPKNKQKVPEITTRQWAVAPIVHAPVNDKYPLPMAANTALATPQKDEKRAALPPAERTADKLDTLRPEENFTEYKVIIRKENSQREIDKLQRELAQYGIQLDIEQLDYNKDNTIKRFKGQFDTDSLFCGSAMKEYDFDLAGSFKQMEFIFRVSKDNNLKYLRIQSDDFEETIECYDDEVLADTKEAQKLREQMRVEIHMAKEEMERAGEEMERAGQEIERVMHILKKEIDHRLNINEEELSKKLKSLERLQEVDWVKKGEEIERVLRKQFKGKRFEQLEEKLEDIDIRIEKDIEEAIEGIDKEMKTLRIEIEEEIEEELKENKKYHKAKEQSPQELEAEAKRLEKEAKALRKKAKKQRKQKKKTTDNN